MRNIKNLLCITALASLLPGCGQPIACEWECVADRDWSWRHGGVGVYGSASLDDRALILVDHEWVATIEISQDPVDSDQRCVNSLIGEYVSVEVDLVFGQLQSLAYALNSNTRELCVFEFDTLTMANINTD